MNTQKTGRGRSGDSVEKQLLDYSRASHSATRVSTGHIERGLLGCSAAAGVILAGVETADASVHHVAFDSPIPVFSEGHSSYATFAVNFDGDSYSDVQIRLSNWYSSGSFKFFARWPASGYGTVMTTGGGGARALGGGESIGDRYPYNPWYSGQWAAWAVMAYATSTGYTNGGFLGPGTRYLGVAFRKGWEDLDWYYGWVQVITNEGDPRLYIGGYAYETDPNTPIQTPMDSTPVPDESATLGLGLLALGAAGVMQYKMRRARQQA